MKPVMFVFLAMSLFLGNISIIAQGTDVRRHLQSDAPVKLPPPEAKRVIAVRAKQVISALKAKNMARLSTFVHPRKGTRFSPYAYVTPGEDLVFTRKEVRGLWTSKRRYEWGAYDGSDDPIRMTFRAYYRLFVYDHDYSRAKRTGYNDQLMGSGNTLNNIADIYASAIVVEYHFPGFDPQYGGLDWTSLWLVFEKQGSEWYLVGVVHDEWTI